MSAPVNLLLLLSALLSALTGAGASARQPQPTAVACSAGVVAATRTLVPHVTVRPAVAAIDLRRIVAVLRVTLRGEAVPAWRMRPRE